MPVTYQPTYENIQIKLRSIISAEFGNSLPVYIGFNEKKQGTQFLQITPAGSELMEYMANAETRRYTIELLFYYPPIKSENDMNNVLRLCSRTEALLHDNVSITLADSSNAFDCRVESTEFNAVENEEFEVTRFTWMCTHMGNQS